MESDSGQKIKELRVDGGAAANNFLMQFQADILGSRIVRPRISKPPRSGGLSGRARHWCL